MQKPSILLYLIALVLPGFASVTVVAAPKPEIALIKEIGITPDEIFEPTSVRASSDGGILVTGESKGPKLGIAMKLDANGKQLWIYRNQQEKRAPLDINDAPDLVGVVELSNGGYFLCGNDTVIDTASLNEKRGTGIRRQNFAKWIRIDAEGKLIDRTVFNSPPEEKNIEITRVHQCGRWGGGAYVLATATEVINHVGGMNQSQKSEVINYIAILKFDANARLERRHFLVADGISRINEISLPSLNAENRLVFAAKGNPSVPEADGIFAGQAFSVSQDGEIYAKHTFPFRMSFVGRNTSSQPLAIVEFDRQGSILHMLSAGLMPSASIKLPDYLGEEPFFTGKNEIASVSSERGFTGEKLTVMRTPIGQGDVEVFRLPESIPFPFLVKDFSPIGTSGKFALVRYRLDQEGNRARTGIILDVVAIR